MGVFFYNIFLLLFNAGIRIAALFNSKARKWVRGRQNIFKRMDQSIPNDSHPVWMHCASLGEFEQGRPLLEKLKSKYPGKKILLTFFSPSGYEIRKDYPQADWVFYLPMDGASNARRFLEIVQPSLVIFVKYEFWYYYLKKISYRQVPLILVSAIFHKDYSFFKWYGALPRKMLTRFDHLFVQDSDSKKLLEKIGIDKSCTVSGDTRTDRVIEIAEHAGPIPGITEFLANGKAIIAGSTWPEDEEILQKVLASVNDSNLKLIVAPHEIHQQHISQLIQLFPNHLLYSKLKETEVESNNARVLIIDNIGMLARLYQYAWVTYIGGGFTKGIHNILEAAVYGKPVLFGPNHQKFREASDMIKAGGATEINEETDCRRIIQHLLMNPADYIVQSNHSRGYVYSNKGATQKIMDFIQEKRLLTK